MPNYFQSPRDSPYSRCFSMIAAIFATRFGKFLLLLADHAGLAESASIDLFEIAEQLTFLVVHMWLVRGGFNEASDAGRLPENTIHLFQRASSSLRIEEVYSREDTGVTGIKSQSCLTL